MSERTPAELDHAPPDDATSGILDAVTEKLADLQAHAGSLRAALHHRGPDPTEAFLEPMTVIACALYSIERDIVSLTATVVGVSGRGGTP